MSIRLAVAFSTDLTLPFDSSSLDDSSSLLDESSSEVPSSLLLAASITWEGISYASSVGRICLLCVGGIGDGVKVSICCNGLGVVSSLLVLSSSPLESLSSEEESLSSDDDDDDADELELSLELPDVELSLEEEDDS